MNWVITPLRIHATYIRKAFSRDFASPLMPGEMVFYLKGDQRKKAEQPIPSSLPEAAGFGFGGSRRKDGVSYTNQVRFSGEMRSDTIIISIAVTLSKVA